MSRCLAVPAALLTWQIRVALWSARTSATPNEATNVKRHVPAGKKRLHGSHDVLLKLEAVRVLRLEDKAEFIARHSAVALEVAIQMGQVSGALVARSKDAWRTM